MAVSRDKEHVVPLPDTSCQTLFLVRGGRWHWPVRTRLPISDFAQPPNWHEAPDGQPWAQKGAGAAGSPAPVSESRMRTEQE